MSNQLLTKVQADQRTSGATRMVLFVLADMANEQGECWPSFQTIAEHAGIDVRTAYRAIAWLEKHGFLAVVRRPVPGSKKPLSNLYRVRIPGEDGGKKTPGRHAGSESSVNGPAYQNDRGSEPGRMLAAGQDDPGKQPGGILASSQDDTGSTPGKILAGHQGDTDSESPKSLINPHFNQPPLHRKPGGQDIFSLYEENFGLVTPMTAELLMDAEKTYPLEWIKAAMRECVRNNTRRWSYCQAILERYRRDGFDHDSRKKPAAGRKKPAETFSERMMRWAEEQEAAQAAKAINKLLPGHSEGKAAVNE